MLDINKFIQNGFCPKISSNVETPKLEKMLKYPSVCHLDVIHNRMVY